MRLKHGGLLAHLVIVLLYTGLVTTAGQAQKADLPGLMRQVTDHAKAGRFAEATSLARHLVPVAEKLAGKEHPLTAVALTTLAELLVLQSQLDEAELIFKRVLAIRERALGPEHTDVAATLASLANGGEPSIGPAGRRYPTEPRKETIVSTKGSSRSNSLVEVPMVNASQIKEHMEVKGSDGKHVGTVLGIENGRIKLASGGMDHDVDIAIVDAIENDVIRLQKTAEEIIRTWH